MSGHDTPPGGTLCVAPLSSPYSVLPRAHTYALVAALFAPLPKGWLFRASLAAFTTRTAIFAVDAVVLLAALKNGGETAAPLDVLVAAEELALACIVAVWLLVRSQRAGESSARGLVRLWAVVVGVGAVVAFVASKTLGAWRGVEGECEGVLMDRLIVIGEDQMLGGGIGIVGDKMGVFILRIGVPGVLFATFAFLSVFVEPPQRPRNINIYDDGPEVLASDNPFSIYPKVRSILGHVLVVTLPVLAILVIVAAEHWIKAAGLPSVEKITSVGQWGVWVATGAVLLATGVNAVRDDMKPSAPQIGTSKGEV